MIIITATNNINKFCCSAGGGLFQAPQAFSSGLGTLGSPAQPSGTESYKNTHPHTRMHANTKQKHRGKHIKYIHILDTHRPTTYSPNSPINISSFGYD